MSTYLETYLVERISVVFINILFSFFLYFFYLIYMIHNTNTEHEADLFTLFYSIALLT